MFLLSSSVGYFSISRLMLMTASMVIVAIILNVSTTTIQLGNCAAQHPNTISSPPAPAPQPSSTSATNKAASSAGQPLVVSAAANSPFTVTVAAQNGSKLNQTATTTSTIMMANSNSAAKMDRQANQLASNTSRNTANEPAGSSTIFTASSSSLAAVRPAAPLISSRPAAPLPYAIIMRNAAAASGLVASLINRQASVSKPTLASASTVAIGAAPGSPPEATTSAGLTTHTEKRLGNSVANSAATTSTTTTNASTSTSSTGNNNIIINDNYPDQHYHKSHVVSNSSSIGSKSDGDNKVTNPRAASDVLPGRQNQAESLDDADDVDYVESLDDDGDVVRHDDDGVTQTSPAANQQQQRHVAAIFQAQAHPRVIRAQANEAQLKTEAAFNLASDLKTASGYNYPEASPSHPDHHPNRNHDEDDDEADVDVGYSGIYNLQHENRYPTLHSGGGGSSSSSGGQTGSGITDGDGVGRHYGKYFQYSSISSPGEWMFGYRRGNPHHIIERRDFVKGPSNQQNWQTKVKWSDDEGSGYGLHVWDYNHRK